MLKLCLSIIEIYQKYLSFDNGMLRILAVGGSCKYSPSCSQYTKELMIKYGVFKGGILGLKRILTCF